MQELSRVGGSTPEIQNPDDTSGSSCAAHQFDIEHGLLGLNQWKGAMWRLMDISIVQAVIWSLGNSVVSVASQVASLD